MTNQLKIAIAQVNPTVGDVEGNLNIARDVVGRAMKLGAELVVFPELFVVGYPPEDLVLKPALQLAAKEAVETLAQEIENGPGVLIGLPWVESDGLYNAVALLEGGKVETVRFKRHLPNYGVFDEIRVFRPGPMPGPINFRGVRLGVPICEDIWFEDVVECLEETGAEIMIVPNGSPFDASKYDDRMMHCVARVTESKRPLIYVNQVGGQDELVFDGASFALNIDRSLPVQSPAWREDLVVTDWRRESDGWCCREGVRSSIEEGDAAIYQAMVLGLRDYVSKNRFPGVVLGLSGGIDSALSAAVAVDALGTDKVHCVMLPYTYTSSESLSDAQECARLLGVQLDTIPIHEPVEAFNKVLASHFEGLDPGVTEENIQSRSRGLILMALSNKLGHMVLTTGNKSEVSVGYATLYGDMCGGFNVLKDIYKIEAFRLSRWRNENKPDGSFGPEGPVMPENIITKPPTAELRENQTDQDSLPPYEELDDILQCFVEHEMSVSDIVARGYDLDVVKRIQHLLYIAEYKRRQAAPGVKISQKNFGRDRRYPITNGFRDKG